jgi:DNA-binding response OmpR family regulator
MVHEVYMSHPRILCLSYDATVSRYRREALTAAGYEVIPTTDVKQAARLLEEDQFNLLLLGHRFTTQQKKDLILLAKKRQPLPVLLVCGESRDSDLVVEGRVYGLQGTEGLLTEVSKLLSVSRAA